MTIKHCPLETTYHFTSHCEIRTCKLYSPATPNSCLSIDEALPIDKNLTDADLLGFKFFDKDMTVKDVASLRKKAIDRVKNIVAIYKLISSVREYKYTGDLTYEEIESPIVDKVLHQKPLSIHRLGFELWMLPYIIDSDRIETVCGPKFKLQSALSLKAKEYAELINVVSSNTTVNKTVL